jgi:hypothetical protein
VALKSAGHDVVRVQDAMSTGAIDAFVFAYCQREQRALLTMNCDDFIALARLSPSHYGLLLHYAAGGDHLAVVDVVRAVKNIDLTYPDTKNLILSLHEHAW